MQPLFADDLESSCVYIPFSSFLRVFVLNYYDNSVAASSEQPSELEEFAELDLLQVFEVLRVCFSVLFEMVRELNLGLRHLLMLVWILELAKLDCAISEEVRLSHRGTLMLLL